MRILLIPQKLQLCFVLMLLFTVPLCSVLAGYYPEEGGKNYVIAGSFQERKNAGRFVNILRDKGLTAHCAFNADRNVYYVYTYAANEFDAALREAKKLRNLYNLTDAWVYTGTLKEPVVLPASTAPSQSYVITGSFQNRKNAISFSTSLHKKGLDGQFAFNPKNGLYYVYTYVSEDVTRAIGEAEKVRTIAGLQDAWVYKGKLTKTAQPVVTTGTHYIIAGAFKKPANADRLVATLKNKGFDARQGISPDKLHYVYIYGSDVANEAISQVASVRSIPGLSDAWVYDGPMATLPGDVRQQLAVKAAEPENDITLPAPGQHEIPVTETFEKKIQRRETAKAKTDTRQSRESPGSKRRKRRGRNFIASLGTGTATYFGDLQDDGKYFDVKPAIMLALQTYFSRRISGRVEASWFRLQGADSESEVKGRRTRNLSFRSDNFELNFTTMIELFPIGNRFYQRPRLNPYGFAGAGVLYYNPKGKVPTSDWEGAPLNNAGEYIALQPLATEGVNYSRVSLVVPFGLGIKCMVNPYINIGLEAGYRMTFTDYLDDVSTTYRPYDSFDSRLAQAMADPRHTIGLEPLGVTEGRIRGNPGSNDSYFLFSLKVEWFLPPKGVR